MVCGLILITRLYHRTRDIDSVCIHASMYGNRRPERALVPWVKMMNMSRRSLHNLLKSSDLDTVQETVDI